jgi:hypothetical protein
MEAGCCELLKKKAVTLFKKPLMLTNNSLVSINGFSKSTGEKRFTV